MAGYGAAAMVVIAGGRLVGAGPGGRRREMLFLAVVSVSPFFREALGNYFHPEDVLALGLLLLALSLASESHWGWAGVALGLAFGSKQWVLLAVPPLIAMAPGRRAKARLLGAAFGAVAVVYAPFILLKPAAAWQVFRGPVPVAGGFVPQTTIVGMLREAPFHVPLAYVNDMARLLPLLFATVVTAVWVLVISRRYGTVARLPIENVLGLLLACVAFRLISDCIALSYYALPLMVLIAVADIWRSKVPAFAIASSFVLAFWYGAGLPGDLLGPWTGAEVFTVGVFVLAGVALLTLRAGRSSTTAPGPGAGPAEGVPNEAVAVGDWIAMGRYATLGVREVVPPTPLRSVTGPVFERPTPVSDPVATVRPSRARAWSFHWSAGSPPSWRSASVPRWRGPPSTYICRGPGLSGCITPGRECGTSAKPGCSSARLPCSWPGTESFSICDTARPLPSGPSWWCSASGPSLCWWRPRSSARTPTATSPRARWSGRASIPTTTGRWR